MADEMQEQRQKHNRLRDRVAKMILGRPEVAPTVAKAMAAGVTLPAIIATILPFVLQYLATGQIDFAAVVKAILALFQPKTP